MNVILLLASILHNVSDQLYPTVVTITNLFLSLITFETSTIELKSVTQLKMKKFDNLSNRKVRLKLSNPIARNVNTGNKSIAKCLT